MVLAALVAMMPLRAKALECAVEDELSMAAGRLVELGRAPSAEDVVAALAESGSDAVNVRARFDPAADAVGMRAWLERLQANADAPLVCGRSFGSHGQVMLVAQRAGRLFGPSGNGRLVRGELQTGFAHPQLVVTQADGALSVFELEAEQLRLGFEIPDELDRVARIQLVASGPAGPRPVAERRWSEASSVAETDVQISEGLSPGDQLRELREAHRIGAVRDNRLLQAVAEQHAAQVCRRQQVAHTLDERGDPEARLRAAGITARVVGETVARSTSVPAAYRALMRSSSHRLTLLDRRFTEAGVAVQHEGEHVCLVVLLAAWPRYVGR